ncbi:MAG: DUF1800 domain-containing protein [Shimia sp.]
MFDPVLAARRFGYGLSPTHAPPASAGEMLRALGAPDRSAAAHSVAPYQGYIRDDDGYRTLSRTVRTEPGTEAARTAEADRKALLRAARWRGTRDLAAQVLRAATAPDPFRERLHAFWADHFTARGKSTTWRYAHDAYAEEAIRPHIAGRFADMLKAAVKHPQMLLYLDQFTSTGENSRFGRRPNGRGLNENLAREVLELHTLGVGGAYGQDDVRQLAELFTGMTVKRGEGFLFRLQMVEPGGEVVLGRSYDGEGEAALASIDAALEDLAAHPDTARHLARKLAVHFVSEAPHPALVDAMAAAYRDGGGRLIDVYRAMLGHPMAWDPVLRNVRWPLEYVAAACRALGVTALRDADARRLIENPLRQMGQRHGQAPGPDGWDEADTAWITPVGIAARIGWAMRTPQALVDPLPDPRAFARTVLGPALPEPVAFAAGAAETGREGVGLVLAAPAFQRR